MYSMLQDANAIGHAQKAGADAFQRLSSAPPPPPAARSLLRSRLLP